MAKETKTRLLQLCVGFLLYLAALLIEKYLRMPESIPFIFYFVAYVVAIKEIVHTLYKNFQRKLLFDENFLLLIATAGAFLMGKYAEAVGAVLLFQVGKLLEIVTVDRTKRQIVKYMDIRPTFANRKKGYREEMIEPDRLAVGDKIIIKPGEKIPVDAVVLRGRSMIDTRALTGETQPKEMQKGDLLYSGSINLSGVLEARVERVYAESTVSRIMKLVAEAGRNKAHQETFMEKFSAYYTPVVTFLGVLVMLVPLLFLHGQNGEMWLYRGLIFLVAACPCGLLISVPIAFLGGIGAASRQGVLIKGYNHLEDLSDTETFIFDKTGTLTEGVFHVTEIRPRRMSKEELLELTAYGEAYSNHPIAVSLRDAYGKEIDRSRISGVKEYSGFGVEATIDQRKVFIGNSKLLEERGIAHWDSEQEGTVVHVLAEGKYAGYILISDVIRPGVKQTIRWMRKHHIETVMLTGDNAQIARAVAGEIGIEYVYADLLPEEKVAYMEEFMDSRLQSEKLAFVGDGINDAPVLAGADVGIAMGGLGADAALESADIILMEDEPAKLINAIRISRETVRTVRQNLVFAVGIKVILLTMAVFGNVTMRTAILADMAVMVINVVNAFWMLKYPE